MSFSKKFVLDFVMSRSIAFAVSILCGLSAAAGQDVKLAAIELRLDHAQLIQLPTGTATVVLGNPKIADITPQRSGFYVLTGKAYGSTNLIAQGNDGQVLSSMVLRVLPNFDESQMTVQRGMTQETLHCIPRCVPAENVAAAPAAAAAR